MSTAEPEKIIVWPINNSWSTTAITASDECGTSVWLEWPTLKDRLGNSSAWSRCGRGRSTILLCSMVRSVYSSCNSIMWNKFITSLCQSQEAMVHQWTCLQFGSEPIFTIAFDKFVGILLMAYQALSLVLLSPLSPSPCSFISDVSSYLYLSSQVS